MTPTVKDIANLSADKLPPLVHVPPVTKPFDITVRPPGSKSLTNRALLLAALAEGESVLTGALADADDAQVMMRALRQLGAEIDVTPEVEPDGESCGNATIRVKGVGGQWKIPAGQTVTLNLNNAGTATRFLTAAAVLQPPESGGIVIDGNARMRERPIGELVDALSKIGVRTSFPVRTGYPPVRIEPLKTLNSLDERVAFGQTTSSQFVSAMLLIAPWLPRGLSVELPSHPTSEAYIGMTVHTLTIAGLARTGGDYSTISGPNPRTEIGVRHQPLKGFRMAIEPDASGAVAVLSAALVLFGGCIRVPGLYWGNDWASAQSDAEFLALITDELTQVQRDSGLIALGGAHAIRAVADLRNLPDAAMCAAVVMAFNVARGEILGLKTLRVKETDRIAALVTELAKIGVIVEPFAYTDDAGQPDEGIRITPPLGGIDCSPSAPRVEFDTYDDHRMAMSLALIGLRRPNVYIRDPGCVRKTYPTFWRDLAKVYG